MKKIAMIVRAWVSVRWFALRHANEIEQKIVEVEQKDERIQLLLQQIELRDKAYSTALSQIDKMEAERDAAMDKVIAAGTETDLQKAEVQRLVKQLQELETKGEQEYAVLPATNGTAKRTRRKKAETPE